MSWSLSASGHIADEVVEDEAAEPSPFATEDEKAEPTGRTAAEIEAALVAELQAVLKKPEYGVVSKFFGGQFNNDHGGLSE